MCGINDVNLELPPGVELSQLLHGLREVDFVGVPVPLLRKATQKGKLLTQAYTDFTHEDDFAAQPCLQQKTCPGLVIYQLGKVRTISDQLAHIGGGLIRSQFE